MRTNQYLPLYAAIVAAGTILAATGAGAFAITGVCSDAPNGTLPSCTCKSPSGYKIQLVEETPSPTQTVYKYQVSGQGNTRVNAIRDVQVVVPRPVSITNQDPSAGKGVIQGLDVTLIRPYCQPDPNSGNNKGSCGTFLVHTKISNPTNLSGTISIPVGRNVADGMVTFNIIGGNGNTELCSAVDASEVVIVPQSGIAGPGDIGDPFQPKFTNQLATVANGKCIAQLIFDKKGLVIDVATTNAPGYVPGPGETNCTAVSVTGDIMVNGEPLKNNNGEFGITFGGGTSTCYGPSIPSPAKCICTKAPCP